MGFNNDGILTTKKIIKKSKTNFLKKSISKSNIVLYKEESDDEKTAIKANIKEFLLNSSLHGLKYTANDELSIFERIFFIISFVLVVIFSGYFINNIYVKWSASPIIISTSPTPIYTSSIPFPAITICGLNKARKSKIANISGVINEAIIWSLCSRDLDATDLSLSNYFGTWPRFRDILMNVSEPCEKMLLYCSFGDKIEECDQLFNPILTDDGLCCIFNVVDPNIMFKNFSSDDYLEKKDQLDYMPVDWTPEKGYDSVLPDNFYPRIALGTGKSMGLTIILNASKEEYYCSSTKGVGFKVLVHNPAELPRISNFGFFIDPGKESRVSIKPTYGTAENTIRSIDKKTRHCLFSDEGNLTYFRWYSRKNCELECEARILVQICKCVLYYLPRLSSDITICGPKDNNCTKRTQNIIAKANTNLTCENCYPACYELSYDTDLSSIRILNNDVISSESYPSHIFNGSLSNIAIVHVYYASGFFRSLIKNEIIGFTEFLSNTGGLLGLFMGFSIFSLIEILYFMSLKPYCLYKKKLNQNKRQHSGTENNFQSTLTNDTPSSLRKRFQKEQVNQISYPKIEIRRNSTNVFKKLVNTKYSHAKVFPYCE